MIRWCFNHDHQPNWLMLNFAKNKRVYCILYKHSISFSTELIKQREHLHLNNELYKVTEYIQMKWLMLQPVLCSPWGTVKKPFMHLWKNLECFNGVCNQHFTWTCSPVIEVVLWIWKLNRSWLPSAIHVLFAIVDTVKISYSWSRHTWDRW